MRLPEKGFRIPQEAISTQKPKCRMLRIASEIDFPKVRTFLESVARGSLVW
jgi:hypothetical protein